MSNVKVCSIDGCERELSPSALRRPQGDPMRAVRNYVSHSTLTERDVARIRKRGAAGDKPRLIAIDYNVSTETVRRILRRETWAHVEAAS